ncbi:MAG: methyltransferase domain-containing protein [Austwickia sp.]|nr:MAG: methyltransferase domain-containing protein [Austwickia sp.]
MRCGYFEAGACGSCVRLATPYAAQLAAKDAAARRLLGEHADLAWSAPCASAEDRFRAKAKMVVAGTPQSPTLGILAADGSGVDLRGCGIVGPYAAAALPVLAGFIARLGLRPYDVAARTGELKGIQVIETPPSDTQGTRETPDDSNGAGITAGSARPEGAEAMIRFVLRSEGQLGKIRRGLPDLAADLVAAGLRAPHVVSANLLPAHAALAEGPGPDVILTDEHTLPMRVGDVTLHLHPGAFLQTNTQVAGALYRQAADWIASAAPQSVLDLYCGVGGFALHAARALGGAAPDAPTHITGVEAAEAAVAGATAAAHSAGLAARFVPGDATAYAEALRRHPDMVIVNPPRRGIGPRLAAWLEDSDVATVVYSSCNPVTLAADLARMPSLRPTRARLFDMFPHTDHAEVLVLLERRDQTRKVSSGPCR